MKKINFKEFNVYTGVSKKEKKQGDVREIFADVIYNTANGIRAHSLALKIYQSDGETEFTDEEVKTIVQIADAQCLPGFIDGLKEQLQDMEVCENENLQVQPIK